MLWRWQTVILTVQNTKLAFDVDHKHGTRQLTDHVHVCVARLCKSSRVHVCISKNIQTTLILGKEYVVYIEVYTKDSHDRETNRHT